MGGGEAKINWALTSVAWLISFIVLLLSATGIHSLMSFTVARRTREIGIRAALGASPKRIVAGIFSRAFLQISTGILLGSGLAALLGLGSMRSVLLLLAADGIMLVVGLTALIAFQAFIIIAGVIRVLPLTGVTLPFVSYGGSSLVANYVLLALLVRVSDQTEQRAPEPVVAQ